jgi:hypothetical protein
MRYEKRSLVYHETVPGHHFQLALIAENKELPRFMQIRAFGGNSAITEGWALYAERLAAESNWYDGDIEGRLGYLDSALFRARRLVVDTGLHAMRWTRQQAIDYGIPPSEVDRYVVRVVDGAATVTADAEEGSERDATVTCEAHEFLRLATGHLSAVTGVLRGRLKVRGDKAKALQLSSVIEFPKAR